MKLTLTHDMTGLVELADGQVLRLGGSLDSSDTNEGDQFVHLLRQWDKKDNLVVAIKEVVFEETYLSEIVFNETTYQVGVDSDVDALNTVLACYKLNHESFNVIGEA